MHDTPPEIYEKMSEMIQKKSPIERLKMGCSMYDTSKYLVTRFILENNPTISPIALRQEIFLKFYWDDFNAEQREKFIRSLEKNQNAYQ